jgi:cytochrome P450
MHSRLLAQHPDVLEKLRGEISSIVGVEEGSRLPDRNTLKKMKYLNLVFKEGVSVLPSPDGILSKMH